MKTAPWIIIIVLILLLFLQRECHRCPEYEEISDTTDTIYLPGDPVPIPYPVVEIRDRWITIYDTIIREVDTAAILRDYFAHRHGYDTLANDSSVFVAIGWHVTQNRLISLTPYIANRKPTTIIHRTTVIREVEKKRNQYFMGVGVGRSPDQFGLAGSLALFTRQQNLYSLHYDMLNKDFYVTFYWRIPPL